MVFFVVTSCKVNLSRCLVLVSESWLRACSLAELLSGHAPVRDGGRACEQRHGYERAVLRGDVRGELDHSGDLSHLGKGLCVGVEKDNGLSVEEASRETPARNGLREEKKRIFRFRFFSQCKRVHGLSSVSVLLSSSKLNQIFQKKKKKKRRFSNSFY